MRRFFDRIHGDVELSPAAARLVASPLLQRLDGIRQLGGCAYVFPSATHTRREHSIGVCHLAGRFARALQARYPELVGNDDVTCVELAGLLHDVGHGPFSHTFEVFAKSNGKARYDHETMGIALYRSYVENHVADLSDFFEDKNLAQHLNFIDLMISGLESDAPWPAVDAIGRGPMKRFLVELVHNRSTGLDVDKLDYLARDALAVLGSVNIYEIDRLVHAVRVHFRNDSSTIAWNEHCAHEVVEIYGLRARLHRMLYQHRNVVVIEDKLIELMEALDAVSLPGKRIIDCCDDASKFSGLTEATIFERVERCKTYAPDSRPCQIMDELYRHPVMRRIPITASLRTSPCCTTCATTVQFHSKFCPQCGESSRRTPKVRLNTGTKVCVTPECHLDSDAETEELRRETGVPSLRIFMIDITFGSPTVVEDAHGTKWRTYDPLAHVVFLSQNDSVPVRMRPDGFAIPSQTHTRTAYCFVPHECTQAEYERALVGFQDWARGHGTIVEEPTDSGKL